MSRRTIGIALLVGAAACAAEARSPLPESHLGRWYYLGSSGGITGGGLGDDPTGYIEIGADGTIEHFQDDGTLVGSTGYEAIRMRTIFSSDDLWVLRTGSTDEAMQLFEDGERMTLSENVYDGFSRAYGRSR